MTLLSDIMIVGIGSDYGDDRAGLYIADRLSQRLPACTVLSSRSPLAVLDHLGNAKQLHLVDACSGSGQSGRIARYEWPTADGIETNFSGTHDFGLIATLQLAEEMGLLPPQVTIWSVEIASQDFREGFSEPITPTVAKGAEILIDQIVCEIMAATSIHNEQLRHA